MTGHRPWHTIRKKSRRCDSLSPSSNIPCKLYWGHEGLHTSEDRQVTWGFGKITVGDMSPTITNDVGDESDHEARESQFPRPTMQEIGKPPNPKWVEYASYEVEPPVAGESVYGQPPEVQPPTQPPPKPADARRSVEPPAYRYKPNLERLTRRPFVNQRDREQVEAMLRHTRPIVEQIRDPLVEKIVFPKADEIEYQYPYQDEAADVLYEFIDGHLNSYKMVHSGYLGESNIDTYRHEPEGCKHCEAKKALDLLNGIIQTQAKKLREYEDALIASDQAAVMTRQMLDETQQQLSACNVDLHDSKQHQLGLMCAEQTDKLEAIRKRLSEEQTGDGYWLALDIEDILDGTSE